MPFRSLFAFAFCGVAACWSASPTIPNRPASGMVLEMPSLGFVMTLTPRPWKFGRFPSQSGGELLVLSLGRVRAKFSVAAVRGDQLTGVEAAEFEVRELLARGLKVVSPTREETGGRVSCGLLGLNAEGTAVLLDIQVLPHPAWKNVYLVFVAAAIPERHADLLSDLHAMQDTLRPIFGNPSPP